MMRWLALAYIVIVLVISAKARASHMDSNPALDVIDHQAEPSQELNVQDPLPEFNEQGLRLVNIDSVS